MAGRANRISLLVDSPLPRMLQVMRGLDRATKAEIGKHTKVAAQPIWQEATRAQVATRLQTRLADSAKVGVTTRNVLLRAGGTGKIGRTPLSKLALGIEFGGDPGKKITSKSSKGNPYVRRLGSGFRLPRSRGYVAYPAASNAIPRLASLWVQTMIRTTYEQLEKVN